MKVRDNERLPKGPRGPEPKTFRGWVASVARKGARRFKVYIDEEKEPKLVAYKNRAATTRLIEGMAPYKVEALDEEGAIVRVWEFKEREEEPEPGYTIETDDSPDERLLKVFAHLLADAHRDASRNLANVVNLQSQNFAEDRRHFAGLRIMNERLMAALARRSRFRVAEATSDDAEGEATEESPDTFVRDLFEPLLKRYMQANLSSEPEGTSKEPPKPNGAS